MRALADGTLRPAGRMQRAAKDLGDGRAALALLLSRRAAARHQPVQVGSRAFDLAGLLFDVGQGAFDELEWVAVEEVISALEAQLQQPSEKPLA